ncbi:ABC transporter ATP-binding protein, partial [Blautia sp.]
MEHITKEFGSFKANDDITLKLKKGEIHALLGENGAGKSTLMSVLFGLYQPEQGTIRMNGKPVTINNPNDANALGIGMVHQHFKLVHNFTVLESIVLGHESVKHRFLKMDEARKKVVELSERYKFKIDPDALISDITVGMQQRVEILKMLYCDNDVLIFDEPTAVLTPQEIDELMKVMKQLVSEGKSILFITHKLAEIKAVADRCTVLRKGRCIGTIDVAGASKEEMSEMMVGRKVDFVVEKKEMKPLGTALSVRDMTIRSKRTG